MFIMVISRLVEQKKQEEIEKKEMEEKQAIIKQLEDFLEMIKAPLDLLGDASPPSAIDAVDGGDVVWESFSVLSI